MFTLPGESRRATRACHVHLPVLHPMESLPLATADIVILLLMLVGAWRGFTKGLVLSVASLVGLVGGVWAAAHFSHLAADALSKHVDWSVNSMSMAALALTFLAVVVAVHLLAKLLEKLLDLVALGVANKLAGAVFGMAKTALIASFAMYFLNHVLGPREWLPGKGDGTVLVGPLESVAPLVAPRIREWETPAVQDLPVPSMPSLGMEDGASDTPETP